MFRLQPLRFSTTTNNFFCNNTALLLCKANKHKTPKAPSHSLHLPVFWHAMTEHDMNDVHRITNGGYLLYYDHVRIRNNWEPARFSREEISPVFEEAAEIVFRIRHAADIRSKRIAAAEGKEAPDAVLRQLDGSAQNFLHSDEASELFKLPTKEKFVRRLVHETLKDANGYVEDLQSEDVDIFVSALHSHRYDPVEHSRSVIAELSERHNEILLKRAELKEEEKFIAEDSEEEKLWQDAIAKLYEANTAISLIQSRKKTEKQ